MSSERTDFLRDYYGVLADDIRRSEAIVPRVCGLEIAVAMFLAVARMLHWVAWLPALLTVLTTAWAMHMLINANLWARRSHLMAANVELEFLTVADMDSLLPRSFYTDARVFRYRRIFRSSMLFSLSLFLVALVGLPVLDIRSLAIWALATLALVLLLIENRNCAKEYKVLVDSAPGRQFEHTK